MKEIFISNPTLIWLKRLLIAKYYEYKYRNQSLKIAPSAQIRNSAFGIYCTIYKNVILADVELGDFSYINSDSRVNKTRIGKFCCIGENVYCGLATHPSETFVSIHPIFYSTKKQSQITFADKDYYEEFKNVTIGNDVWIGNSAAILGGVAIGDGAIIGAGSFVTKDIPPYAIVGGVPAKFIKNRFSDEEIKFLNDFKWWDRDFKWLKDNYKKFHNIEVLVKYFSN